MVHGGFCVLQEVAYVVLDEVNLCEKLAVFDNGHLCYLGFGVDLRVVKQENVEEIGAVSSFLGLVVRV